MAGVAVPEGLGEDAQAAGRATSTRRSTRSPWPPATRPGKSFDLPFDEKTGEIRRRSGSDGKSLDPIEMLDRHATDLKKLDGCSSTAGPGPVRPPPRRPDLRRQGPSAGGPVLHEEFDDDHSSISYRYDRSLPILQRYLL
jgi:hypothetical protein